MGVAAVVGGAAAEAEAKLMMLQVPKSSAALERRSHRYLMQISGAWFVVAVLRPSSGMPAVLAVVAAAVAPRVAEVAEEE